MGPTVTSSSSAGARGRGAAEGFALIAVLVALSVLIALTVPFLLSMGNGETAAYSAHDTRLMEEVSASVREWERAKLARSHPTVDPTPAFDGKDEFPDHVELPPALAAAKHRALISGEVEDLQRRINLNSATPLLLANLLGLSARVAFDHQPDAKELTVDDASRFPETDGYLLVDLELIQYGRRDGSVFKDLKRGLRQVEDGFLEAENHLLRADTLVLDYRVVLAVTYPIDQRNPAPPQRQRKPDRWLPWESVEMLASIREAGFGGFSSGEMDVLRAHCTVASQREHAGDFGRAERVFLPADAGTRALRVRSTSFLGAGTVVRIRSLNGKQVEYGLCMSTAELQTLRSEVALAQNATVTLLKPLSQKFDDLTTVVEPLLPHPVNVNTASETVLAALIENVREGRQARAHQSDAGQATLRGFTAAEASNYAKRLLELRGDLGDSGGKPFESFEALADRFFRDLVKDVEPNQRWRFLHLYESFLSGRSGKLDMCLAPLCFASAPVFSYRAAAAFDQRPAGSRAARVEREGIMLAMPGHGLVEYLGTQDTLEEATRIERESPWWLTTPINVGTVPRFTGEMGAQPPSRHVAHMVGLLFPDQGFGQQRFPARTGPATCTPQTASAPFRGQQAEWRYASLFDSQNPEGRDVGQEGPYEMFNDGPRGRGAAAPPTKVDHGRVTFPFTEGPGFVQRCGVQFWFKPTDLTDQALFDLVAGDPDRNRISLQIRERHLQIEVLDEAGVDPDPNTARTSIERTAGRWKVPLEDFNAQAGIWYHVNLAALGNRGSQLLLAIDGVPRGEPDLRTHLVAALPEYRDPRTPPQNWRDNKAKYLELRVKDARSFPPRGVVRIGLELFEYSKRDDSTLYCKYEDSLGGRVARMDIREYRPDIPVDEKGRPRVDIDALTGGVNIDYAPAHPEGSGVELYGYSLPIYRDHLVQVGSARLGTAMGAFAIARGVVRQNPRPITVQFGPISRDIGVGMDETWTGNLDLADPIPDPSSQNQLPPPAGELISNGFPATGGYALLMQVHVAWNPAGGSGRGVEIGGYELVKYASRDGSVLKTIERAVALPQARGKTDGRGRNFFDNLPHKFVSRWDRSIGGAGGLTANQIGTAMLFVVPISLPVSGAIIDPAQQGYTEWLQILGRNESDTEWVRYDAIDRGVSILRTNFAAWSTLHYELTQQLNDVQVDVTPGGGVLPAWLLANPWPPVTADGVDYIGYPDPTEVQFPAVKVARLALRFRGDPLTRTSSHKHDPSALVTQCHRFELDWGRHGGLGSRVGRNDRVALVAGSKADGEKRPDVDWHTVNWQMRQHAGDIQRLERMRQAGGNNATNAALPELFGPWPFQLAAFKGPVRAVFFGPEQRNDLADVREIDRLVKFPSGELPAAAPENGTFGGSSTRDVKPMRGLIDELAAVRRVATWLVLEEPMTLDARAFKVRPNLLVTPATALAGQQDLTRAWPQQGMLALVDGEVLGFSEQSDGRFVIATNGRGLLGTEARAHDEGAQIQLLEPIPAAALSAAMSASTHQITVNQMGSLPVLGGTLLAGRELLHYTWSVGGQLLEMPVWFDPDRSDSTGEGLFRGRYGTVPNALQQGEMVIAFPFRYWDRYHRRAEDPELAHWQLTSHTGPVYYTGFLYEVEKLEEPLVKLHCHVRIDGLGSFADDPAKVAGQLRFDQGKVDDRPNKVDRQGSRFEARFRHEYLPGAFDPLLFRANGWKRVPSIREIALTYEGEGRLLAERITTR